MLVHSADEMRPKQDGGPGELLVCATEPDLLLGGGEGEKALRGAPTATPASPRSPHPSAALPAGHEARERAGKKNGENEINICFKNSLGMAKRNLKILSSKAAVSEAARSDGCLR